MWPWRRGALKGICRQCGASGTGSRWEPAGARHAGRCRQGWGRKPRRLRWLPGAELKERERGFITSGGSQGTLAAPRRTEPGV